MAVTWRGHTIWTDAPSGGMFKAFCSCGYESAWRNTEGDATGSALNHMWRVTVAPEYPVKGRMVKREGETMSKSEFLDHLRASA